MTEILREGRHDSNYQKLLRVANLKHDLMYPTQGISPLSPIKLVNIMTESKNKVKKLLLS